MMCVQYRGDTQYRGGNQHRGELFSTVGDILVHVGDILNTVGDVQYHGGNHDKCEGISCVP